MHESEDTRRGALKIIGAIGTTCAFPFAADELYGQHTHPANSAEAPLPTKPQFFNAEQFAIIARLADLIIPATDTPGALAAGAHFYVDMVVGQNANLQENLRKGLALLDQQSRDQFQKPFVELTESQQISMLTPWSELSDAGKRETLGPAFFYSLKGLVADGYYTSRTGLLDELGYRGNTVLSEFPSCVPEH